MQNDENASIRYLMKEMDPSEELLMERAMMEDDDLLIEVEGMRQTYSRLDELPEIEPPEHLTESIIKKAAEHKDKQKFSGRITTLNPISIAAAAAIVFAFAFAGIWLYQGIGLTETEGSDSTRTSSVSAVTNSSQTSAVELTQSSGGEVKPWVDKDNMILFEDRWDNSTTEFDSMLKNSFQKLTPLTDPFNNGPGSRSLQMTGTNK